MGSCFNNSATRRHIVSSKCHGNSAHIVSLLSAFSSSRWGSYADGDWE